MECSLCNGPMTKVSSMNSGNSRFETYRCTTCGEESTKCLGLEQDR